MAVIKWKDLPVEPYRAALMAFLLSEDAGRLKRSALFCSLCSTKSFYQNTFWRQKTASHMMTAGCYSVETFLLTPRAMTSHQKCTETGCTHFTGR